MRLARDRVTCVHNLTKLADFDGNYVVGDAGATIGGSAGVRAMKNQNGVVIELESTTQGQPQAEREGLKLSLMK